MARGSRRLAENMSDSRGVYVGQSRSCCITYAMRLRSLAPPSLAPSRVMVPETRWKGPFERIRPQDSAELSATQRARDARSLQDFLGLLALAHAVADALPAEDGARPLGRDVLTSRTQRRHRGGREGGERQRREGKACPRGEEPETRGE
eukprot:scaffold290516_cov24-Tisochrysis_lutea.AAC.1